MQSTSVKPGAKQHNNKMETRHVRIGFEEGLTSKKHLLTSEINLLQTLKKVKNYRTLRKRETATKNKLKTQLKFTYYSTSLIKNIAPC